MRRMCGLPRQWKTTSSDTEGARRVRSTVPVESHGGMAGQLGGGPDGRETHQRPGSFDARQLNFELNQTPAASRNSASFLEVGRP
jgi:hypothetical protein